MRNGEESERGRSGTEANPKTAETPRKRGERSRRHPPAVWWRGCINAEAQSATSAVRRGSGSPTAGMQLVSGAVLLLGLAALLHAARNVRSRHQSQATGRRLRLELDPSVWPELSSTVPSSLADRSLSPWTYTGSSEESRLPRWIYNAECLTAGCLSLQGEGEDAALEAAPIYYPTLVLHRVPRQRKASKKNGRRRREKQEFQLRTAVVSVGCTCVRPTAIHQQ